MFHIFHIFHLKEKRNKTYFSNSGSLCLRKSYTQPVAFMTNVAPVIASYEGSLEVDGSLMQQSRNCVREMQLPRDTCTVVAISFWTPRVFP